MHNAIPGSQQQETLLPEALQDLCMAVKLQQQVATAPRVLLVLGDCQLPSLEASQPPSYMSCNMHGWICWRTSWQRYSPSGVQHLSNTLSRDVQVKAGGNLRSDVVLEDPLPQSRQCILKDCNQIADSQVRTPTAHMAPGFCCC